jgi:hypothetical protein
LPASPKALKACVVSGLVQLGDVAAAAPDGAMRAAHIPSAASRPTRLSFLGIDPP